MANEKRRHAQTRRIADPKIALQVALHECIARRVSSLSDMLHQVEREAAN